VATLLGRPPADPLAPGAVGAEQTLDGAEVVREVVLREQVDEQRRPHRVVDRGAREVGVVLVPLLAGDRVLAAAVRHVLVREPLLGGREVPLEQSLDVGGQFSEHGLGADHALYRSLPTDQ